MEQSLFVSFPYEVLSDKSLSSSAKLLYGEISALARKDRICRATNVHFAEVLGISERYIQNCLRELRDAGYIEVDVDKSDGGTWRSIKVLVSARGGTNQVTYGGRTPSRAGDEPGHVPEEITKIDYTKESNTPSGSNPTPSVPSVDVHSEVEESGKITEGDDVTFLTDDEFDMETGEPIKPTFKRKVQRARKGPYLPPGRTKFQKTAPTLSETLDPFLKAKMDLAVDECENIRKAKFVNRESQYKALLRMKDANIDLFQIIERFRQLHNEGKEVDLWGVAWSFDKKPA